MSHMEKNVMSAQMLEVSLLEVGTVLRLERDAWSMVKWLEASNKRVPPPHLAAPSTIEHVFFPQNAEYAPVDTGVELCWKVTTVLLSWPLQWWYSMFTHSTKMWPKCWQKNGRPNSVITFLFVCPNHYCCSVFLTFKLLVFCFAPTIRLSKTVVHFSLSFFLREKQRQDHVSRGEGKRYIS